MLFHILKRDLVKRKGVNAILFIFITLATVFLASSVNNIMVVSSAVDYYMDYAEVPEINFPINSDVEKPEIDSFLNQERKDGNITDYTFSEMVQVPDKGVIVISNGVEKVFDAHNASMLIGTMDEQNKVFDQDAKPFTLKDGEVAVSSTIVARNDLKIGDTIKVKLLNQTKEFTIAEITKDFAFGSDMVGMTRFIVNEQELASLRTQDNAFGMYNVACEDEIAVNKSIVNQSYDTVLNVVNKGMYQMVYSFDMIFAALLILIGICLILIALLVLRFTLVFTMEEQYQEIGILKAIGLRDYAIKKLYLLKYLALVCTGSLLGFIGSFPISNMMVNSVSENMIMERSEANYLVNFICAVCIIVFVLGFCYLCTRKLDKVSAITAIHGGNQGERFHKPRGLALVKRMHMPIVLYLGLNDIFTHLRRYAVLIITFCISFILITIPLNTLNTMGSSEMARKFGLNPESTTYVKEIELNGEEMYTTSKELEQGMNRVKAELKEHGYDASLTAGILYFMYFEKAGQGDKVNLLTLDLFGDNTGYLDYSEGVAPILENEVAFSKQVLKDNEWQIGDRVTTTIANQEKEFIITGSYSDYMQIGQSARLSPALDCSQETMFEYSLINVDFETELNSIEIKDEMKQILPDYEWQTANEFVDKNIGGIQEILQSLLLPITIMLCGVIMLITLLMERLFITREKGEIAMMKSIGFPKKTITLWQVIRMCCVVMVSMIISIPLSLVSNQFVLKPIFAIMGADIVIQVDAIAAYLVYPGVLLIGILIATYLATQGIRHINIREMNNLE